MRVAAQHWNARPAFRRSILMCSAHATNGLFARALDPFSTVCMQYVRLIKVQIRLATNVMVDGGPIHLSDNNTTFNKHNHKFDMRSETMCSTNTQLTVAYVRVWLSIQISYSHKSPTILGNQNIVKWDTSIKTFRVLDITIIFCCSIELISV